MLQSLFFLTIPYMTDCLFSINVNKAYILIRENKIVTLCTNPGYSVFTKQYNKHDQELILEKKCLWGRQTFVMSKWGHGPKKVGNHWFKELISSVA